MQKKKRRDSKEYALFDNQRNRLFAEQMLPHL
jgi:hypothetical protein